MYTYPYNPIVNENHLYVKNKGRSINTTKEKAAGANAPTAFLVRVSRFVSISSYLQEEINVAAVQPSAATVHRTVAFKIFESLTYEEKKTGKAKAFPVFLVRVSRFELEAMLHYVRHRMRQMPPLAPRFARIARDGQQEASSSSRQT